MTVLSKKSIAALLTVLLAGCAAVRENATPPDASLAPDEGSPPPLYQGLGEFGYNVTTDVDGAQRYFDLGLSLSWGFNFEEARRAFREVVRLDPECAMGWWGLAFVEGPNINDREIPPERWERAHELAQRARAFAAGTSDLERALIRALAERYVSPVPDDCSPLLVAYADAMREVWGRFPEESIVGALFADALMNINKDWRNWGTDEERGPIAVEAIATLERVLEMAPEYAAANHLYIHAVEASPRPERALESAKRLESLMPAAGHMVHMPGHIYIRLGMYDRTIDTNRRAIDADDAFFAGDIPRVWRYHLYRAHNHHFLSWAAMFRGSYEQAMSTAREMMSKMPEGEGYESLETYRFVPMHVLMRFGRWKEMLEEPDPGEQYPIARSLWHQGRAVAQANLGRFDDARAEAAEFEAATGGIAEDTLIRSAPRDQLLEAARQMMWGEILFKEGDREEAFEALRKGVEAEDSLPYAEPPGWMQPVRHSLGALLLDAGKPEEAEAVYRADLDRHANNVWSLHGLAESLRLQDKKTEAQSVEERFREASKHADVTIRASCFCRSEGG